MARFNRKKGSSSGVKALKMVKTLVKAIEVKNLDTDITDATLASVGIMSKVFEPSENSSSSGRDGDKVFVKRVTFNWQATALAASTAAAANGYVRVIVVRSPQVVVPGTASEPVLTDILETATVSSLWNKEAKFKYSVLYDKTQYIAGFTGTAQSGHARQVLLNMKQKVNVGKGYVYDSDGTNTTNQLYMLVLHSYETEDIAFEAHFRTSYTDN